MERILNPNDLISLPRLDGNQAVVLAQQLEAAALDQQGDPLALPATVQDALDDVRTDRAALQEALGSLPDSPEVNALDKLEDNAIAALFLILIGWSRVKDQLALGDTAAKIAAYLGVEQGLGFINITPRDEFGVVDTKLKTIEREQLEGKLGELGLTPLLAHLRDVHGQYGAALGITRPLPPEQRGVVGARYKTLLESLRHYAGAVMGSVSRKRPETKALADTLLRPLATWRSDAPQKTSKEEGGTTPGGATPAPEGATPAPEAPQPG